MDVGDLPRRAHPLPPLGVAGLVALVLSRLHRFYRRGPRGSQTWELVHEPVPKGREATPTDVTVAKP